MSLFVKSNPGGTSEYNLSLIFDVICRCGPISKADIVDRIEANDYVVRDSLATLLNKNIITDIGKEGEPVFSFAPQSGSVIAIDVGGTTMAGALVSLTGEMEKEKQSATHGGKDPVQNLIDVICQLQDEASANGKGLLGIALGVPGVTDRWGQSVTLAPGLGWHGMDIGKRLEEEFCLPVWVDNDVNAFLRGEYLRGSMQGVTNGIGITIGTGIGSSLLIHDDIYQGSNGAAGEIGYWAWSQPDVVLNKEKFGELESFAAGPGIARRAKEALEQEPRAGAILRQLSGGDLESITAREVFAAAIKGDPTSLKIVQETAHALGMVLANLSSVLDVERIVIGGGVALAGEILLEPISQTIQQLTPYPPEVVQSRLGYRASIIGVALGFLKRAPQNRGMLI